jgi:hypothetical protein
MKNKTYIINGKEVVNPKLPTEFKEKWLEALRSGKFKQGISRLHNLGSDKYCCLGVACRIMHPKIKLHSFNYIVNKIGAKKVPSILKDNCKKVPSILKDNCNVIDTLKTNDLTCKLADMNDKGRSFKQIANWIEKNL